MWVISLLLAGTMIEERLVASCRCRYRMLDVLITKNVWREERLEVAGQLAVLCFSLLINAEEATKVLIVVHRLVILLPHLVQLFIPDLEQIG